MTPAGRAIQMNRLSRRRFLAAAISVASCLSAQAAVQVNRDHSVRGEWARTCQRITSDFPMSAAAVCSLRGTDTGSNFSSEE